jgi:hypothetical protein
MKSKNINPPSKVTTPPAVVRRQVMTCEGVNFITMKRAGTKTALDQAYAYATRDRSQKVLRIHELYGMDFQFLNLIKDTIPELEYDLMDWEIRIEKALKSHDLCELSKFNDIDFKLFDWFGLNGILFPTYIKKHMDEWESRLLEIFEITEPYRENKVF